MRGMRYDSQLFGASRWGPNPVGSSPFQPGLDPRFIHPVGAKVGAWRPAPDFHAVVPIGTVAPVFARVKSPVVQTKVTVADMNSMFCAGILVTLLLVTGPSLAESASVADNTINAVDFSVQRARVEQAISKGVRYAELSKPDRAKVLQSLDRIGKTLASVTDPAQLPVDKVVAVKADQAYVNEVLAEAERMSALRCENRGALGSNIRSRHCETAGALRRRLREESTSGLNRLDVLRTQ